MKHDHEQPKKNQGKKKNQRPKAGHHRKDPLDYPSHPYPSMRRFAEFLALRYDTSQTRHSYYRDLRLIQEHHDGDPAGFTEEQVRDYILFVKSVKEWQPKTIRQSAASARLFFVEMLGHDDWEVFSQIRTKDHDQLPEVLTRDQVVTLLCHVRLRRYRIPLKLIYCCGGADRHQQLGRAGSDRRIAQPGASTQKDGAPGWGAALERVPGKAA